MATKLVRLVNDKKKSMNQGNDVANVSSTSIRQRGGRDFKTEEYVAELESKIGEIEQQNRRLRENVNTKFGKLFYFIYFFIYVFYDLKASSQQGSNANSTGTEKCGR